MPLTLLKMSPKYTFVTYLGLVIQQNNFKSQTPLGKVTPPFRKSPPKNLVC